MIERPFYLKQLIEAKRKVIVVADPIPAKCFIVSKRFDAIEEKIFISFFWLIVGLRISDVYLSPSHVDK